MELIFYILSIGKDYFSDAVLLICVVSLFVYQIRQTKITQQRAEEASAACSFYKEGKSRLSQQLVGIVQKSLNINKHLDCLVYKLCADRVQLYVFHNSGYDLTGQPFAKVTNTNESVVPGVKSLMENRKDLPVGLLAYFVAELIEHSETIYENVNDIEDLGMRRYFETMHVKSSYAVAIFAPKEGEGYDLSKSSKGAVPIGFVCLDYIKKQKTLTDAEFKILHETVMIIKGELVTRRSSLYEN